jgi:DNA polymerase V
MKTQIFALIDCNNFFVSCLRVFNPQYENTPMVALSSNDGCVVARSNEAKVLGIPMGAPAFKWRQFFKDNGVVQMSGNFELYGDMSRRITALLTTITPHIEIYSVDESFLDLSELDITDYTAWGREVVKLIKQYTGIPVSIGIGSSKTLAKLGAARAKKDPSSGGVLDLATCSTKQKAAILKETPVQDVWGIGWRLTPRLRAEGIFNALQLADCKPKWAQQRMGIIGRQTVAELNGICCSQLNKRARKPKSIAITRTFGQDTTDQEVLEGALTLFTAKAAHKLRLSNQLTRRVSFFMTTNKHKPGYQVVSAETRLLAPSADSGVLIEAVVDMLRQRFSYGQSYHRAGVWLHDFISDSEFQHDLLDQTVNQQHTRQQKRMTAVDTINRRYGKHTLYYASEDLGSIWQPKHQIKTPRFTTRWDELPKIRS